MGSEKEREREREREKKQESTHRETKSQLPTNTHELAVEEQHEDWKQYAVYELTSNAYRSRGLYPPFQLSGSSRVFGWSKSKVQHQP
jgi:hypothetical protein